MAASEALSSYASALTNGNRLGRVEVLPPLYDAGTPSGSLLLPRCVRCFLMMYTVNGSTALLSAGQNRAAKSSVWNYLKCKNPAAFVQCLFLCGQRAQTLRLLTSAL